MKNFTYYRPATAEAAVGLLDARWGTAELLAGGTDLLDLQKEYVAKPDKVVSLGSVKGLAAIDEAAAAITLGAGAKLAELAAHVEIVGGSPMPMTPRSGMSCICTMICGMSSMPPSL